MTQSDIGIVEQLKAFRLIHEGAPKPLMDEAAAIITEMVEALEEARSYVSWHTRPAPEHISELLAKIDALVTKVRGIDTPETRHERTCEYVTNDGPAPCTCKAGKHQERP